MAPIRRYLRITPHTALEARIYLDNPTDANWLLKPSGQGSNQTDTPLHRVVKAVQPLVLPKLREENTRTRTGAKGKKTKGVKDTVSGDDFEASVFLVESGSRHAVLVRHRDVKPEQVGGKGKKKWTWEEWRERGGEDGDGDDAIVIPEEDEDKDEEGGGGMALSDYPEINTTSNTRRRNVRKRRRGNDNDNDGDDDGDIIEVSDDEGFTITQAPGTTSNQEQEQESNGGNNDNDKDDKKKLGLITRYDGFSIYGRILCLIIKRRGSKSRAIGSTSLSEISVGQEKGREMLENWVSTQAQRDVGAEEVE